VLSPALTEAGRRDRALFRLDLQRCGAATLQEVCVRFVLGSTSAGGSTSLATGAANSTQLDVVRREGEAHGDLVWLPEVDDTNCAEKSFQWFMYAARKFVSAAWIGKVDVE
jgi:hypothetical protein